MYYVIIMGIYFGVHNLNLESHHILFIHVAVKFRLWPFICHLENIIIF